MATPPQDDRATATKIGEVRPCGFLVMRADRQTDRQTDKLITILLTPPGNNAIN